MQQATASTSSHCATQNPPGQKKAAKLAAINPVTAKEHDRFYSVPVTNSLLAVVLTPVAKLKAKEV